MYRVSRRTIGQMSKQKQVHVHVLSLIHFGEGTASKVVVKFALR